MITKYFTNIAVQFKASSAGAHTARTFLAAIPLSAKTGGTKIVAKVLPEAGNGEDKIEVKFKDGHVIKVDPKLGKFVDLSRQFDSHSQKLKIAEKIDA
ncbi:hypothetical protein B0I72DRAFT_135268 [Yarrowia lipolytica]|uniref:Large ribosomal subunit protein mL53 n=2 Tax=Yarrowia lipolytica TaxID=4952 RepID=B5RSM3_YARLI|nr:YALI0F29678p [Yarrowia lipolytica CLIB122]AOW07874.1 hypothetical protein YALI1_F37248g [Yarrowia lipolytica]KAB8282266.1 hypothetical protein BKA91DRAFT_138685 [Yarrowia lipolytica]KAE8172348.1 hypothetical protein BKA90DRAFT_137639 [Yarrowia lipolytica]KAJ8055089.1 hypothetical protein LXG23DRAFT_56636 [Yarrowia lipolytica]QNP99611.1 54S ribosomal protein L44 [Yarrowia lipolytica]|eukprot:XP_002143121.1 YALI0F29678p [Yarrowia lipolytica CLIB122]